MLRCFIHARTRVGARARVCVHVRNRVCDLSMKSVRLAIVTPAFEMISSSNQRITDRDPTSCHVSHSPAAAAVDCKSVNNNPLRP